MLNDQVQRLIETEYLYSIGGKYLSDRSCAQKVNLSDKMVLSKILEYLEEEIEKKYLPECESWLKKADVDISISVESIWQRVEQEIYDYAYPRYYPKCVSLFHREKVLWDDVKYINHDVIHKAEELLGGYEDDWCAAIEKKLVPECAQESREDELLRKQDEKIRRAKEAMKIPQGEKEKLQRERQKTEDLMHDDQNRLKEYVGKAEEAYREQRSDILKRVANSCKAEDKMHSSCCSGCSTRIIEKRWEDSGMKTSVQETDVQKMDEGSKSEVEQLLSGCIVTPLLKEMQKANQCLVQGEQKGRENLLKDIKTQHGSTKGELPQIIETQASGLQSALETDLNQQTGDLKDSMDDQTDQLRGEDGMSMVVLSRKIADLQEAATKELDDCQSALTEMTVQKYKVLLGVSLSFGAVNFIGILILLVMNFMG